MAVEAWSNVSIWWFPKLVTYRYKFELTYRRELFESPWCPESLSLAKFAFSPSITGEFSESHTDLSGRYVIILDLSSEEMPSSFSNELPASMNFVRLVGCSSDMLDWKPTLRA